MFASEIRQFDVDKYLHSVGKQCKDYAMDNASRNGHLEMVISTFTDKMNYTGSMTEGDVFVIFRLGDFRVSLLVGIVCYIATFLKMLSSIYLLSTCSAKFQSNISQLYTPVLRCVNVQMNIP